MAVRSILNYCVHKLKPYRQFSSSTLISKNLYKSSLPILSTPWLMLPPDVKDGPNGPSDNYWNIIDKSIVKIDRPTAHGSVPFNTKCIGSAKGWVAFDCDSDGSLFLANPYTEARCHKLPAPPQYPIFREGLHFTLAGDPMSNNFELIQESRGILNKLCLAAYNRKADTLYKLHFEDSGKLQLITKSYPLEDDETGDKGSVLSLFFDPKVIKKYEDLDKFYPGDHSVEKYLVVTEEKNPSLLLVIRHLAKDEGVQCETKDIKLFEIDLEGDGEVKCVESIGDQVLFLGRNSEPFFISTQDCSTLKSNCVYVADDLGYYDLETKSITPFLSLGDLANIRPHVYWVAPPLLVDVFLLSYKAYGDTSN